MKSRNSHTTNKMNLFCLQVLLSRTQQGGYVHRPSGSRRLSHPRCRTRAPLSDSAPVWAATPSPMLRPLPAHIQISPHSSSGTVWLGGGAEQPKVRYPWIRLVKHGPPTTWGNINGSNNWLCTQEQPMSLFERKTPILHHAVNVNFVNYLQRL